jgi:hypothetical protein
MGSRSISFYIHEELIVIVIGRTQYNITLSHVPGVQIQRPKGLPLPEGFSRGTETDTETEHSQWEWRM